MQKSLSALLCALCLTGACRSETIVPGAISIAVTPSTRTFRVGDTVTFRATVQAADFTDTDVTWRSRNPAVFSITPTGSARAVSPGTAEVTVMANRDTTIATLLLISVTQ